MTSVIRSVLIRVAVDSARGVKGTKELEDQVKSTSRTLQQHGRDWDKTEQTVTRGSRNIALATAAGFTVAERSIMSFDKTMSGVDAATHETAANLGLLRAAAIKAGADTQYSATEAAQGITELAKAGIGTRDILGGGLKGALSLAAAGQLSVAESAETAASAMTQFRLSGKDVPHIADLLAAGAGKAQGSVHDLGMALNQSGLVASQTGLSIEETTGALAAFASAGLIGSDAGTSFKTMLLALNPKSEEASKTMKALGFSAYDAKGQFVGLEELARRMRKAFKDLTPEQRNTALMTIFGTDAIRAANIVYRQGGRGIGEWIGKVNEQGYAAETAARQTDNLAGDIERFTGSLESAFIKSGTGAQAGLRDLVQTAEKLVDRFAELPPNVQAAVVKVLALTGATAGTLFVLSKLVGAFRDLRGVVPTRLGRGLAGTAGEIAGSKNVVPVYVTNLGKGLALPGAPTSGGPAPVPIPGGAATKVSSRLPLTLAATSVALTAGGVFFGSKTLQALQYKLFEEGAPKDAGVRSQFVSGDGGAVRGTIQAALTGKRGHTLKSDAKTALADTVAGGIGGKFDRFVGKIIPGGSDATKALANIRKLDEALATLHYKDATRAATEYAKAQKDSGLSAKQFAEIMPVANAAMSAAPTAFRDTLNAIKPVTRYYADYNAILRSVPKRIRSYVSTPGAALSVESMIRLRKQYDLTPKQVRTIMRLQGFTETQTRIVLAGKRFTDLPKEVRTRVRADTVRSEADVKRLQRRYDLTPRQVRTLMQVSGVDAQIAKVHALQVAIAGVRSKSVTLETVIARRTAGNNVAVKKAAGGQVLASGDQSRGARADSIPAALSHREFVHQVSAVDYYGERFMHAVNNRTFPKPLGFAGGGQAVRVGAATAVAPTRVQTHGHPSGLSLRGIEITGTVTGPFGPQELRGIITDVVAEADDMKGMRERARR